MRKLFKAFWQEFWGPMPDEDTRSYGPMMPAPYLMRRVFGVKLLVLMIFLVSVLVSHGCVISWLTHLFALNH